MISREFIIVIALGLGLIFFIAVILRQPPMGVEDTRARWRKRFRIGIVLILFFMSASAVWAFFIEPDRLVVHSDAVSIDAWPPELSGLRIAMIGDVHTDTHYINEAKLQRIVELTNQQHPDLIVLLGDYIQGGRHNPEHVEPEVTAKYFKNLKAPLGVYGVLGNHDWWYNGEKVRQAFESEGIPILEDDARELSWRGKPFWLVGLADFWTRPQHIAPTIAKVPEGSTIIALTHNPDIFPNLPPAVPLLLAAHTHGGQVNFPLVGTPVVPSRFGSKYTSGHVFENNHHMYVTTGIGTSIMRVRFRVPPEIMILTVNSTAR
ncbi:MAG TPA: metallophosphoesterase [Pyrinomonadaceae bacterium]|nr:metallophosphoesterase [Pyrinomonadaceae bacterium]